MDVEQIVFVVALHSDDLVSCSLHCKQAMQGSVEEELAEKKPFVQGSHAVLLDGVPAISRLKKSVLN